MLSESTAPVRLRVPPSVMMEVKDERLPALEEWVAGKGVRRTKPAGLADPVNCGRFVLDHPDERGMAIFVDSVLGLFP